MIILLTFSEQGLTYNEITEISNKYIDKLKKKYGDSSVYVTYKFPSQLKRQCDDNAYALYYDKKKKIVLNTSPYLDSLKSMNLELLRGLLLHEYGHYIETNILKFFVSKNGISHPWMNKRKEIRVREYIADNFAALEDVDAFIAFERYRKRYRYYSYYMRHIDIVPNFWYLVWKKIRPNTGTIKILQEHNIIFTDEICTLIDIPHHMIDNYAYEKIVNTKQYPINVSSTW